MARNKRKISRKTKRKHLKKRRKSKKRGGIIKLGCDWIPNLDDKIVCEIGKVIREQQAYKEDYDKQQTKRSKDIEKIDIDNFFNLKENSERIIPYNRASYIEKNEKLAKFLFKKLEDIGLSNEPCNYGHNPKLTFTDKLDEINKIQGDLDVKLSKLILFNKKASELIKEELNKKEELNNKEELNKKEKELIEKLEELNNNETR
jgi:hypothetical protein